VARLRAAGAILVGKTNLDQFATGLVGVRTPYPRSPRNAFDLAAIVPGGSWSGSAVAAACPRPGQSFCARHRSRRGCWPRRRPALERHRRPEAVGRRRARRRGVVPACRSLDCVSVFALTVDDAHAVFSIMAGPDPGDPWSAALRGGADRRSPAALRIGVPARTLMFDADMHAATAWKQRPIRLAGAGRDPSGGGPCALHGSGATPMKALMSPSGTRRWAISSPPTLDDIVPVTRKIVEGARRLTTDTATIGWRSRASDGSFWRTMDAIAVRHSPPRACAGAARRSALAHALLGAYTNFVNLLDLCALAVPARFRPDGLPSGLT